MAGTLGVSEYEGKTLVSPKKMVEINLHVFYEQIYSAAKEP